MAKYICYNAFHFCGCSIALMPLLACSGQHVETPTRSDGALGALEDLGRYEAGKQSLVVHG